jgi:hypothetical protein
MPVAKCAGVSVQPVIGGLIPRSGVPNNGLNQEWFTDLFLEGLDYRIY